MTNKKRIHPILLVLLVLSLLSTSCLGLGVVTEPTRIEIDTEIPVTSPPTDTPQPTSTTSPLPTLLPTLTLPVEGSSGQAFTPTITPLPSDTPTATPHPMLIAALRQRDYPGSDIVIESELEPGANYRRYYTYYLSDGLKIYALLTVPNGEMPSTGWPAIVFNHGYIPPDQYRTTERYIAYVDNLARNGYIVFRIDYRGHDRSEGSPSGAYGSPGYAIDVLNAVASIQRFPQADPERIGMWGHSMGGYLTLRAMVVSPQIKAGVIWAGVVGSYPDLLTRWRRNRPTSTPGGTSSLRRSWRNDWTAQYGSPEENPEFWAAISSNNYVADISGPVQLHHGTGDDSVPYEFSEILFAQLQEAGMTSELYLYDGDNHNLSNYFSAAMQRTIEFYNRYLRDAP